jgi:MbtH protein
MSHREDRDDTIYKVVISHDEQYSIWPAHKAPALGWSETQTQGTKVECLAFIKSTWIDMRPKSLRDKMLN